MGGSDTCTQIAVDDDQQVVVGGIFSGTATFAGTTVTASDATDGFLAWIGESPGAVVGDCP